MSSEWDEGEQDVYRDMWNYFDEPIDFTALHAGGDWSFAQNQWSNDPNFDIDPASSSTFGSSPPHRQPQLQDHLRPYSLVTPPRPANTSRQVGNSASANPNPTTLPSQQPRPSRHSTQTTAHDRQRRTPAASHCENWLDHAASQRRTSFAHVAEGIFQSLDNDSQDHNTEDSAGIDIDEFLNTDEEDAMAPTTRRRRQAPATNNTVVDLTNDPSSPPETTGSARQPISLKRSAESSQDHTTKRRRQSGASASQQQPIEELDLTNPNLTAEESLRQAQRAAAIAAQQADSEDASGPLKIGKRTCIICMEPFTNATITHCGHIYCHECLIQALRAGEKNSERGVGNCPVCRKPVNRHKQNQIIPLAFMKKSAYKGKAKREDEVGPP